MEDNIELFEEQIEEIREFAELDMDLFHDVLECTRGVVTKLGDSIVPVAVVDIVEGAVGHLVYETEANQRPVTAEEAVARAVANLHLADEINDMFEEDEIALSDEIDTSRGKK